MIWKNKPTAEQLGLLHPNTLVDHLGIKFTEVGDDFLKATMPVDHRTKQPYGLLHGGASVALAETMGSVASALCIENVLTHSVVGVEINANHLKSARKGLVTGVVKPIKLGRRLHVWNIEIFNDKNEMVCISRLTTMIIEAKS